MSVSKINLNREFKILLRIIKTKNSQRNNIFEKESLKIDWNTLIKLSIKHEILPLLYKKLASIQKSMIPHSELLKLKSLYLKVLQSNLTQADYLKKILKILTNADINVIPIKGPVLSIQAYGDLGFRVYSDLDILINHMDFSRVYDILIKEEYKPSSYLSKKKKKMWVRSRRDIEFYRPKVIIDLHQRLSQAHVSFSLPEEEMKEDYFVSLLDQKIRVLSPENTILYMIINHTKDQWNSLRMVSDLSHFLYNNTQIDWEKLIKKAKEMGILRMVLSGFLLLKELIDETFPELIIKEMKKDSKIDILMEKYKKKLFSENRDQNSSDRIISISRALDSNRHRLHFLLYFIFAPTPEDFRIINFPEFLYPLYYLFRPFRLFTLFVFNFLKNKK